MKHRPFVLLTTLIFAMAACSGSDDATTATGDQTTEGRDNIAGHDRNHNCAGHDGVGDQ